jgi:hypothetical protein
LAFPGEEVRTVADMNWRSLTNGRLLEEAAAQFDLFITLDQNLEFQNPVARQPLGILVLVTPLNDLATYRPHFGRIRDSARKTKSGQIRHLRIS